MHILRALALATSAMLLSIAALAQGTISNLPREETIIIENPEGTVKNPGWFNYWAVNAGGRSTGLQQLAHGYVLVYRSRLRHRRRLGQLARRRKADLQRRLHRDDGQAAAGHLLE